MIEVLQFYSGVVTGGRTIRPGLYAKDDPALFNAVGVMLAKGYAREVQVTSAIVEPDAVSVATSEALAIADAQHTAKTGRGRGKGGKS